MCCSRTVEKFGRNACDNMTIIIVVFDIVSLIDVYLSKFFMCRRLERCILCESLSLVHFPEIWLVNTQVMIL